MNIRLPENFNFDNNKSKLAAYVKDGILYIVENLVDYEVLMYALSYSVWGQDACFYCGRKLTKETRTLDHMYPKCWGGISIPDNMVPCCELCNKHKSNMDIEQYNKWQNTSDKQKIYEKFVEENQNEMKNHYILPEDWVTSVETEKLRSELNFELFENYPKANQKIEAYYNINGYYPKPVVITKNNWVLTGRHIVYHAKKFGIKRVPCVVLNNVIKIEK